MTEVPAKRVRFPVGVLFPHDAPFSIRLLQLMLATDDLRHLRKFLIAKPESEQAATKSEQAILNGEVGHLFRLMCGHLCEAMKAFVDLDKECGALLDAAMPDDRGRNALTMVRQACTAIVSRKGYRTSFVRMVRNLVGFHYDPLKLKRTLGNHGSHLEGTLVLSPYQGLGRYTIADHLVMLLIADEMGTSLEEFQESYTREIGKAIDLVGALSDVVDYFIGHLLANQLEKIEESDEVITVDPAIERAREEVERARTNGTPALDRGGVGGGVCPDTGPCE